MAANSEYGRTALAPITVLAELAINLSGGRVLPSAIGKTAVPVQVLPEVIVGFGTHGKTRPPSPRN